ncbi:ParB N-terminal domain-containing protein [Nonlabens sp.]|uniref:ParB N-terminal domain-containing protein n=1 Tax=Nonlabens sp. TaxID=1888209 RepID=UPI0025E5FC8A|nr:ParB N-terminal domain-containing protein [Nonlabens sp.]
MIEKVKLSEVKSNPNNPRLIKDEKFSKLVKSIKEFPKMLEIRPIVVNDEMVVLGGNMRLKACKEAGLKEIPIIKASDLTEEQQREFIIKDNVGFGEWDWDILVNDWQSQELKEWGLDVWQPETEVDYSILDEEDVSEQLEEMTSGVKKAIQIEFEPDHYDEAYQLVKFWRDQDAYVGKMILDFLKAEKNKL